MEEDTFKSYTDFFTVQMVALELSRSRLSIDMELASYLGGLRALHAVAPKEPIVVLGDMVQRLKENEADKPRLISPDAKTWGYDFISEIFKELRIIVCGKGKTVSSLGSTTQAAISATAAVIAHKLNVANATAIGIAVLVFLSIGNASKKAFCHMTTPEQLRKLID